jgi:hypothetical protein
MTPTHLTLAAVAALAAAGAARRRGSFASSRVRQLSDTFRRIMAQELSPQELVEIDALNVEYKQKYPKRSICASHDFIDSNQVMLDAMEELGIEFDPSDQKNADLINDAWSLAKAQGFSRPI